METPAQTCSRLLAALEDLAAQEAAALAARDFPGVVAVQQRAAPLIEFLGAHGPALADGDSAFRARVAALQGRRRQMSDRLTAQVARAREELRQVQARSRWAARVAPVYGRVNQVSRQFCAQG